MFEALRAKFEQNMAANQMSYRMKLVSMKLRDGDDIEEFITKFDGVVDELRDIEENFSDRDAAIHLLMALPESMWQFRNAIEGGKDFDDFNEIKISLRSSADYLIMQCSDYAMRRSLQTTTEVKTENSVDI